MSRPLEVLIHHMRSFAGSDNAFEAGFARSILKQSRKPSWRPSGKQRAVMDRLVAESFNETDDLIVIEE